MTDPTALLVLADELEHLPYLPETGGDGHLNRIIPALRAAAADLERAGAIERALRNITILARETKRGDGPNRLWVVPRWQLDEARDALAGDGAREGAE